MIWGPLQCFGPIRAGSPASRTVRQRPAVHRLSRPRAGGAFDWRDGTPPWHYQGWKWADQAGTCRERMDLPAPGKGQQGEVLPAPTRLTCGARYCLEGAVAPLCQVSRPVRTREETDRRRHRCRARTGGVHLGDREGGEARIIAANPHRRHRAEQGWGRGNGRGTPVGRFVAGTADARSKIGNAPDAQSEMR